MVGNFFNKITSLYYQKQIIKCFTAVNKARVLQFIKQIKLRPIEANRNGSNSHGRRGCTYTFAACGLFSWDQFRISNEEVKSELTDILKEFNSVKNGENDTDNKKDDKNPVVESRINFEASRNFENEEWTKIYDKKDLLIWRRKIGYDNESGADIYEHKVLGRFDDLTPIEYYQVQIDLAYRTEWDFLIKMLKMISKDAVSNTELVRWVSKFPYPLADREYMFVRRYCIEPDEKLLILINRGIPEVEDLSYESHTVKVTQYKSNTIIIPYTDFDRPGLYYIIQYYDVNKAKIPKLAYKWIASSGLPDYVAKLHKATLKQRLKHDEETDKNLMETFEFFRMSDKSEKLAQKDSTTESEVLLCEASKNQKENKQIKEDKPKGIENIKDSNGEESETQLDDVSAKLKVRIIEIDQRVQETMPEYLKEITQKLNEDYFISYEPHPVFYNY